MSWLLILCRTLLVDWLQLNHLTAPETVGRKGSTLGLGGRVHIMKMESLLLSVMCWIETKKNCQCPLHWHTYVSTSVVFSELSKCKTVVVPLLYRAHKQTTYISRKTTEWRSKTPKQKPIILVNLQFYHVSCFYIEEFCQLYLILSVLIKIIYLYMYMWISITHMYIYLYKNAYSWLSKGAIAFPLDSLEQLDN